MMQTSTGPWTHRSLADGQVGEPVGLAATRGYYAEHPGMSDGAQHRAADYKPIILCCTPKVHSSTIGKATCTQ